MSNGRNHGTVRDSGAGRGWRLGALLLMAVALGASGAWGATCTWSGAAFPDPKVSTPGNWDVAPGNGDNLIFSGIPNTVALFDALAPTSYGTVAVSAAAYTLNVDTSVAVTFTGAVTNGTFLLTIGGAGNLTMNAALGPGSGGLTKSDAGTLTLSGTNTYTGGTTINGGILALGKANTSALPTTGKVFFAGGTLKLFDGSDISGRFDNTTAGNAIKLDLNGKTVTFGTNLTSSGGSLAISDSAGGGALSLQNRTNSLEGGLTLNSGTASINGSTNVGSGTLTLSGGRLYIQTPGGTTVTNNLTINGNVTLEMNSTGNNRGWTFSGTTTFAPGLSTLTINNTSTAGQTNTGFYFPNAVLNTDFILAGTELAVLANNNGFGCTYGGAAGTLTWSAARQITFSNTNFVNLFRGALAGTGGALTLAGASTVTWGDATTGLSGSSAGGVIFNGPTVTASGANTYTDPTSVINGIFRMQGDTATLKSTSLVVSNPGIFEISNSGNANPNRIPDNCAVTLNGGTFKMTAPNNALRSETVASINCTNTGASKVSKVLLTDTGSGNSELTAGTLAFDAGASLIFYKNSVPSSGLAKFLLNSPKPANDTAYPNVAIYDPTYAGAQPAGAKYTGTPTDLGLVPTGVFAPGTAYVSNGTGGGDWTVPATWVGSPATPPGSGDIVTVDANDIVALNGVSAACTLLTFNGGGQIQPSGAGGSLTVYGTLTTTGTGSPQITCNMNLPDGPGAYVFFDMQSTGTLTVSGALSGIGGFTKIGAGTLLLSGANAYTGATIVNAGTLKAGVASVANVSGAFGNNSDVTLANVASAILDLNGNDTQIGSLTGGGATGGNVALGGGTLTVAGAASTTYAGVISGTGGLTRSGAGTLTLSGINTFDATGKNVTVSAGTLVLAGANAYVGNTTVNAGATLQLNHNQGASSGVITLNTATLNMNWTGTVANNLVVSAGTSTLMPSAANTYTFGGNVTLNGSFLVNEFGYGPRLEFNGQITGAGGFSATINGNNKFGRLVLTCDNSFQGGVGINSAGGGYNSYLGLEIGHNHALGTGTLSISSNGNAIPLKAINGDHTVTNAVSIATPNTPWGPTILFDAGSTALTLSGPLTLGSTTAGYLQINSSNLITISGPIGQSVGGTSILKTGTGPLQLSGASTYTGLTILDNATLQVGGNAPSGSAGALGISTSAVNVGRARLSNVRAGTTANLAALSGLLTVDTVVLAAGDRVLVKNQTTTSQNGIYVAAVGAWSRDTDMDGFDEAKYGVTTKITAGGQINQDWYISTLTPITLGTTAFGWTQGSPPSTTVSLLASTGGITIGRNINLSYNGADGVTTLGGIHTTGTSTFSGTITVGSGTAPSATARDVTLTAASGGQVDFTGNLVDPTGLVGTGGTVTVGAADGIVRVAGTNNTYTGLTNVTGGTLLFDGTLANAATLVTVDASTTLGGSGTIARPVLVNGSLAPGTAIGTLNVTGDTTFGGGGRLLVDVAGVTNDLLAVTGNLDLTTDSDTLEIAGGSTLNPANSPYTIVTYSGTLVGGSHFDTVTNLPAGWTVDYSTAGQVRLVNTGGLSVTDVQLPSGPAAGGTAVTVTGTGFDTAGGVTPTGVDFGGSAATAVVVLTSTTITCTTTAHVAGAVTVTVTNPGGATAHLDSAYTYILGPAPTGIAVNPNAGTRSGGQHVTVTGSGFVSGATVTFDTSTVGSNFVNGGALTCVTPAHTLGAVGVRVTNPYGASSDPAAYTYFDNWEGDVAPRDTGGDGAVSIVDWVQIGRFAALLDPVVNGPEFQKADCADRGASGDGDVSIADWVQAGRYAAALDPLQTMGGPTAPTGIMVSSGE